MGLTPTGYKARYWDLPVTRSNGTIEKVRLNKYRLVGKNFNDAAKDKWWDKHENKGIDIELKVDTGNGTQTVKAETLKPWAHRIRYPFTGKGSPEQCQIVLQLADRWGLAPEGLQKYADDALGLDCNGFVGNFLWHEFHNNAWDKLAADSEVGPDSDIPSYVGIKYETDWDKLDVSNTYVMGMVDNAGHVIPGGSSGWGHVVISEPNTFRPFFQVFFATLSSALWVVESTGALDFGLTEGWYSYVDRQGTTFTLRRENMNSTIDVKIGRVI